MLCPVKIHQFPHPNPTQFRDPYPQPESRNSHLETPASATATSPLEFPSLALDMGLLSTVRAEPKVLDGFPGVLRSTEKEGVGTGRRTESKLIQGDGLSTGSLDPSSGSSSESDGSDGKFGDGEEAVVVCDGANDHDRSVLLVLHVVDDLGEGYRGSVHLGHEQTTKHHLVECGIRPSRKEAVELDE